MKPTTCSLIIMFAATLLTGCVFEGTGTGNPMVTHPSYGGAIDPNAGSPASGILTVSDLVAIQLCATAVRCHSDWNYSDCTRDIYPLTVFAPKLGIMTEPPPSLNAIHTLETTGQYLPDSAAAKACLDDLSHFDCANASEQDTVATLADWLSPTCAGIEKPANSSSKTGDDASPKEESLH